MTTKNFPHLGRIKKIIHGAPGIKAQRKCEKCEAEEVQEQTPGIQPSLEVGPADDPYEREADEVADRVMRMPDPGGIYPHPKKAPQVQAKGTKGPGFAVPARISNSIKSLRGGGRPLPTSAKSFFEPRFGQDFSKVRLHTDGKAADAASSIRARAFALGNDIAFAKGAYNPGSSSGKRLLAHELTHTVQQGGAVKAKPEKIWRAAIHTGNILDEGSCEHLACNSVWACDGDVGTKCPDGTRNAYSKTKKKYRPLFYCDAKCEKNLACSDSDTWMAAPKGRMKRSKCGQDLVICANGKFTHAQLRDKSEREAWEVSHGIQDNLGVSPYASFTGSIYGDENDPDFKKDSKCRTTAPAPAPAPTPTPVPPSSEGEAIQLKESETVRRNGGPIMSGMKDPLAKDPSQADEKAKTGQTNKPAIPHEIAGDTASKNIVRIAWTFDDGPTSKTAAMQTAVGVKHVTWFVMYNEILKDEKTNLASLKKTQTDGGEIGIHSFHKSDSHVAWFPMSTKTSYSDIKTAMKDLDTFNTYLKGNGINPKFVRLPYGLISELTQYLTDKNVSGANGVARKIIDGTYSGTDKEALKVKTEFEFMKTEVDKLKLHLWGGSGGTAPEIAVQSWEAETSGVKNRADNTTLHVSAGRKGSKDAAKDNPGKFERIADLAVKDGKPHSLVVLGHDTTQADVDEVLEDKKTMEAYAVKKKVRIEYYTMSGLYQTLRGTAP